MIISGKHYRTIFESDYSSGSATNSVMIIDQRRLPFEFVLQELKCVEDCAKAIKDMAVRGAPLIGVTAAYGMYLAAANQQNIKLSELEASANMLLQTRPTAVNLAFALHSQLETAKLCAGSQSICSALLVNARALADDDVRMCTAIGEHGKSVIERISREKNGGTVNILTHCNAGWLATVDRGTALAPVYAAHESGIRLHVWVDETRPRNQGARLTAFELMENGIPCTLIVDNAGGHLMQHGMIDLCIVGSDRTTRTGDCANKIGTYLKALAAFDNGIPFYTALPSSSIDWAINDGISQIEIEERSPDEVLCVEGISEDGTTRQVYCAKPGTVVSNYGFDVTPARLITGIVTERGISKANENSLLELFPEMKNENS